MSLRIGCVFLFVGLLSACGDSNSPSAPSTGSGSSGTAGTPVSIVSGASTLTTTAYSPNPLNVTVGTTVTWTNNDNMSHTSTANNGLWSSPLIGPGGQFSTTFTSAGSFAYKCTIHPGMVGTVNVQ
jgi:plastocyanin